jgi:hypothetical protein
MKERSGFLASIAAGVILAILVGAALTLSYPATRLVAITTESSQTTTTQASSIVPGPTTTSTSTATVTESTTIASSVTAPCSSPGVQCGSFQITSATLVASPGADSASNLTITLANTGNVEIGAFEVFLDYVVNGSTLLGGLPAGQQTTISVSFQNDQFLVTAGETYTVLVEAFLISDSHITANLWGSAQVLASSKSATTTSTTSIGSTLSCTGNCTFNPPWPVYQTMSALKEASPFVVVANVTSESVTSVNSIPLTVYQLSVVENIEGPGVNKSAGMMTLPMAQIGGTANGTTVSIEGYPTLSVGSTYVLFLNGPGSLYPSYYAGYLTSVGGPQGTFLVQRGGVFSLDTVYPKADVWLPIKANDVPLSQFIAEVQAS